MFAALLDTCVLYPSVQRDFLLSLAIENLYRPLWSSEILAELYDCEVDKLLQMQVPQAAAESRAARLITMMRDHFDDAEVENWESYVGTFGLPDLDDEHVLAAAQAGHAGAVVTLNLKDFPAEKVPHEIQIITPTEFAANTVAVAPEVARGALATIAARSNRPPVTVDDLPGILCQRYAMHEVVELMTEVS